MNKICLILFILIPFHCFSNSYISSIDSRNDYRLVLNAGVNRIENHNEELYEKLRWIDSKNDSDEDQTVQFFYENFISLEFSRRFKDKFSVGGETGVFLVNSQLEENSYEMTSVPLLSVLGVQFSNIQISVHGGVQVCVTDDFLVGDHVTYPLDVGIRLSYRGLQTRVSFLFADEKSFRRGLVLSVGYNLMLM